MMSKFLGGQIIMGINGLKKRKKSKNFNLTITNIINTFFCNISCLSSLFCARFAELAVFT